MDELRRSLEFRHELRVARGVADNPSQHLLDTVPELNQVRDHPALNRIAPIRTNLLLLEPVVIFEYAALAPDLFPHVKKNLIAEGVAKRHNILYTPHRNKDTPEALCKAQLSYFGGALQVFLYVGKQPFTIAQAETVFRHV